MKKVFSCLLIILTISGILFWSQKSCSGFSVSKISSPLKVDAAWTIEEPGPAQLEKIFSQPFFYLKSGSQSYAFESLDGRFVIKFFRMKHLISRPYDFLRPAKREKKKEQRQLIFGAYKLAYDKMREDTGLLYIHLNKTSHLQKKLQVFDKAGHPHGIDLDRTEFVVQEKAELIFSYLQSLLKKQDRKGVSVALEKIKNLIRRRSKHGISDHDHGITNNFGFVGDRPIQIDIGRLYLTDQPDDNDRICRRIDEWLNLQNLR